MSVQTRDMMLDAKGIDEASEAVAAFLADTQLDRRNALSARLTFENALLRLREHFGEGTPAQLVVGKRMGRPFFQVRVKGERFDPRELSATTDWERSLMEASGMGPTYAYRGGCNIVGFASPLVVSSMMKSTVAIALGFVLGFGGRLIPFGIRESLLAGIVTPLFDTYVGMLSGIAGPMVFLSVAWGICGIGDMVTLGRSGKALVGHFLRSDLLATVLVVLACLPLFDLGGVPVTGGGTLVYSIVQMLLDLLPTNIFSPFLEGNTLQIIVLSVVVGVAALALGNATEGVRSALRQLNTLVQFLMEQLCRLLPGFIVVMMVSQSWSGTSGALMASWFPILVIGLCTTVYFVLKLIVTRMRCHIPLTKLVRVMLPALVVGFTTASLSAAFGTMRSTCEDDLGVDSEFTSFGVPLGMVLAKPGMAIMMAVVLLYSAQVYGVGGGVVWYVKLAVSCLLYAVAVPPVPGGSLACYGMLLAGLGIPLEALGVVTAIDFLMDNLVTCGNVGTVIIDVLSAADSLGVANGKPSQAKGGEHVD